MLFSSCVFFCACFQNRIAVFFLRVRWLGNRVLPHADFYSNHDVAIFIDPLLDFQSGERPFLDDFNRPVKSVAFNSTSTSYSISFPTGLWGKGDEEIDKKAKGWYSHFNCVRHEIIPEDGRYTVSWFIAEEPNELEEIRVSSVASLATSTCALASVPTPFVWGRDVHGSDVTIDFTKGQHMVFQGSTGSGKSNMNYLLLAHLAQFQYVQGAIFDPNNVLGKAFRKHSRWKTALGVGSEEALLQHISSIKELVEEMDIRLKYLDEHDIENITDFSATTPLAIVVLEEYPSLLSALDGYDKDKPNKDRLRPEFERCVGRLLREGRKAGIRIMLVLQRADANALDTQFRSQFGARWTFLVDNLDGVRFLHPSLNSEDVEITHNFKAGMCWFQSAGNGKPVQGRSDYTEYSDYLAAVRNAAKLMAGDTDE